MAKLLDAKGVAPEPKPADARKLACAIRDALKLDVAERSVCASGGVLFALGRRQGHRLLVVASRRGAGLAQFEGHDALLTLDKEALEAKVCATDVHANGLALRRWLPFTAPQVIGLAKSFGFGDRLGLATPGHIRSMRKTKLRGFFAQQSIREMTRSGRSPEVVMDDASFGILEEGFREPVGSDADHLKNTGDADICIAAGFTLFTIDPGEHVDDAADREDASTLRAKFDALPWKDLETTPADYRRAFLKRLKVSGKLTVEFTEETLLRGAAKYAKAVLHTARIDRHIASKRGAYGFELEVSVDETASPTSVAEHYYVASELRRLGVRWVSLAPRFIGRFEKGVDYIGDLKAFEQAFVAHVDIAKHLGPYKMSLHSGSDKFSVYPIAAKHAGDLIHVKTAGTSYLEALRVIAALDPALFRGILDFAFSRYEEDKKSYHVSAELAKVPRASALKDSELPGVLDLFDGRQLLHVTYGSVLMTKDASGRPLFRDRVLGTLKANPEAYAEALVKHMGRHVSPFARGE